MFLRESPDWFGLDLTHGQAQALYVAAEKDTFRQLLTGWLAPYGIPVLVVRGFGSQSYVDVVRDRVAADQRKRFSWWSAILTVVVRMSNATGRRAPRVGATPSGCC